MRIAENLQNFEKFIDSSVVILIYAAQTLLLCMFAEKNLADQLYWRPTAPRVLAELGSQLVAGTKLVHEGAILT